ncbi:bifunctional hydroxymethylpyrimidine kinase/phosphomethylpyrimidine kinase [Nocardia africana]|uniref:Bifunctional hydroxymethylpyrimidine kinase/phosphomethylpyrimidine kinase n=1 Tax=Nocardia africana TaxID=134964 RepID=A0ABW6NCM2_9NOCA
MTIGSSDSSGGAGIQGDIKAMASIGCYATTVIVGVTAQNTRGVTDRFTVPVPVVLAQLDAVSSDIVIDAIKIGTTWSAHHVTAVAEWLTGRSVPIVVDPVMVSAAGAALGDPDAVTAVRRLLLPLATIVTPNLEEARLLTGLPGATPRQAAEHLVGSGVSAAIVTCGGPAGGEWYADASSSHEIPRPGHRTGAEHGAGCAHSALITGLLAQGMDACAAAEVATSRAAVAVRDGLRSIGQGVHPVDTLNLLRVSSS